MLSQDEQWLLVEKYGGEKTEGFFADVQRLQAGEPLAYLICAIPFLDCHIHLDSKPLIPRPETEFWAEKAIADIKRAGPAAPHVLDLCAGSGAIGIAVAKAIQSAHVTLAEIDPDHLSTIGKNLSENKIDCSRYQVFESDLFKNLVGTFDYILSNPPYIDPSLDRAEQSVTDYEPALALYGGRHGLEIIEQILIETPNYLNPNGTLYLEHEPEQVPQLQALAAASGLNIETHNDQYNLARYSVFTVAQ